MKLGKTLKSSVLDSTDNYWKNWWDNIQRIDHKSFCKYVTRYQTAGKRSADRKKMWWLDQMDMQQAEPKIWCRRNFFVHLEVKSKTDP